MALSDLSDPRIEKLIRVYAYELYDSHGDAWPVFWSGLEPEQKLRCFRMAAKSLKIFNDR